MNAQPRIGIKIQKGRKFSKAPLESDDDEGSEDCLSEFFLMATEEEREEDFERAFEEVYMETIYMTKKNKELKEQLEEISKEKDAQKEDLRGKEEKHSIAKNKVEEL